MPFWDSVSTHSERAHDHEVVLLVDLVDLHLDRVRDLLARAVQHLLAHELGEHDVLGLVGDLLGREVERPLGQQPGEVVDQRGDAAAGARRDREHLGVRRARARSRRCSASTVRGRSSRSTLLTAITTGTGAPASASAMKRSPGPPTPCSPLTTNSAASASLELGLDAALHPLGQRVARALHARQVGQHELEASGARDDAADRAPGRLRLVGDDRDLLADHRVDERRLADVRPAGERDEAGAGAHRIHPMISACRASISPSSVSWSMPVRCSTPWTTASSRSVVCSGQITTSPSSRGPAGVAVLVDRERQHVGRPILAAVVGVELGDALGVDELDRHVAVVDPRRRRRQRRRPRSRAVAGSASPITSTSSTTHAVRRRSAGRSSEAERSACSS